MSSIPESSLNRSAQVVFRLRAAFLIIVVLLLIAVVVVNIQMRYLTHSQAKAIEVSVPALAHSHKLESLLAKIILLQGQIRTANTTQIVDRLSDQFEQISVDIDQAIALSTETNGADSLSQLTLQLEQLGRSYTSLLPVRIILIGSDRSLSIKRQSIVLLRSQFRELIEPQLIDTGTALNIALNSIKGNGIDLRNRYSEISKQVNTQNKLTEISFHFLAIADTAEQLSRQNTSSSTDEMSTRANLHIRSATQLLASFNQDDFRRDLASLSNKLRDVIRGQGGILAELLTKAEYQGQLDAIQANQTELVTSISKQISDVVNTAKNDISVSADVFEGALFQTITTLIIVGLLIVVVVLLVCYFVVERQINQRISQLTEAVLDIAKGDSSRNVSVSGCDEIGMMANALKVFKDTAIKLRTSNEELEQFAYAASHDLRSPLRAIQNLAQWTIEDAGDHLPADCHENLKKILERAERLSTLQTDLLEYSRAGHESDCIELVNIKSLVIELSEILDPNDDYSIEFSGHTNSVNTHVTPLRQILINLINNAIKHHDRASGTIRICIKNTGSRILIAVQDDGPGIEPDYQEQVFELFKMLQSQDEVEGSGLGLALVRKLVSRYDGKISLLSNPVVERGTEFNFDWPIHAAANH